jgi:hypothetical protein
MTVPADSPGLRMPADAAGLRTPAAEAGLPVPADSAGLRMPADAAGLPVPAARAGLRVLLENEYSGRPETIEGVDTVVLAWGGRAVDQLHRALKGKVPHLELVGDAMAPRRMHDAMLEGTRAGRRI